MGAAKDECHVDMQEHESRLTEVLKQSLVFPYNSLVDVGSSVGESLDLTGFSAKETVEVGTDLSRGAR